MHIHTHINIIYIYICIYVYIYIEGVNDRVARRQNENQIQFCFVAVYLGVYTILPILIFDGVWHAHGGSGGRGGYYVIVVQK